MNTSDWIATASLLLSIVSMFFSYKSNKKSTKLEKELGYYEFYEFVHKISDSIDRIEELYNLQSDFPQDLVEYIFLLQGTLEDYRLDSTIPLERRGFHSEILSKVTDLNKEFPFEDERRFKRLLKETRKLIKNNKKI